MRALQLIRLFVVSTIIGAMSLVIVPPAVATSTVIAGEPEIDPRVLRDQLTKGLKVTRPEEQEFVDKVVAKVDAGDLELRLVYAMFKWSRRRRPSYPFPYFKLGMIRMAKKEGVDLTK